MEYYSVTKKGMKSWYMLQHEYGLLGWWNVLRIIVVTVLQFCEYTKKNLMCILEMDKLRVCELYLSKTVNQKKKKELWHQDQKQIDWWIPDQSRFVLCMGVRGERKLVGGWGKERRKTKRKKNYSHSKMGGKMLA